MGEARYSRRPRGGVPFRHPGCKVEHGSLLAMQDCIEERAKNEAARLALYVRMAAVARFDPPYKHPGCLLEHEEPDAFQRCLRRFLKRRADHKTTFRRRGLVEAAMVEEWVPVWYIMDVIEEGDVREGFDGGESRGSCVEKGGVFG